MSKPYIKLVNIAPPLSEFIEFRANCGWGRLTPATAKKTLEGGIVNTTAFDQNNVAGFGRIIGDGAIYFYVQDLIVGDTYRGQGLGVEILSQLIDQVRNIASPGASLGLMSALDKEEFYKQFGFACRPNSNYGAGMTLLLDV